MRSIIARAALVVAAVLFGLGVTSSAAHAVKPKELVIGPVTVCKIVTFFDIAIWEYDCYTEG
jgi:hypothetical protein